MSNSTNTWALILAAGAGSRLHSLTTTSDGVAVPKQFCSLYGGQSLLQDALDRADHVAPQSRVCCIVAAQHRRWWSGELSGLPAANIIVQPDNRGTGNGILLPLTLILARDPDAQVVILPADHYLRDETAFAHSLQTAAAFAAASSDSIYLLGIEPDESDAELGYIVPTKRDDYGASFVSKFVEKPTLKAAHALRREGALWNAFILAARARQLVKLYEKRFAGTIADMEALAQIDTSTPRYGWLLSGLYQRLTPVDFSRDVLEGQEAMLRVLTVPHCGWTDLGTPQRVARVLQYGPVPSTPHSRSPCSVPNLSARHLYAESVDEKRAEGGA
jgi:mannose-1-phosphate guanylyltransferase